MRVTSSAVPLGLALSTSVGGAQGSVAGDTGRVAELTLTSHVFHNTRAVRVYVPPGYDTKDSSHTYPVLYLNDGFAVFSQRLWNAPHRLDSLIRAHVIPPLILVGIDNAASIAGVPDPASARADEYLPYPDSTEPTLPNPHGLEYPRFVVDEVMPLVARSFRVRADREGVGVGGSSYGGIAALTTALTHPDRFGFLLLESTPLFLFHERLIDDWRRAPPRVRAVYIGVGTRETDDSAINTSGSHALDRFEATVDRTSPPVRVWLNRVAGESHTAAAWGSRLPDALRFLLATSR